jgi:hypothetical protein
MNWLGGVEVVAGAAALIAAFFLMRVFRYVPQPGVAEATPGAMRVAIIPVGILLVIICGISLLLRGAGLI